MTNIRITTMRDAAVAAAVKGGGEMVCICTDRFPPWKADSNCPTCLGHGTIRVHYIGRKMPGVKASPLGNPWKVGGTWNAARCLEYYEMRLRGVVARDELVGPGEPEDMDAAFESINAALDAIITDLNAGRMVWLAVNEAMETREPVWPAQCHGDVLAKVIKKRMGV